MIRILLVEDSSVYREALRDMLQAAFPTLRIAEASSTEQALESVKRNPPDLVFVDIKLPGESGLVLTRELKLRSKKIIVAILTSYNLPEYREAANKYNADYFLLKGATTPDEIVKLIGSLLPKQTAD